MSSKICFKCSTLKDLSEYYKHKEMKDGHLNKCKSCTKLDAIKVYKNITSTEGGIEKERIRHKEKYKRLNYKEKQKIWDENKPWKNSSKYKNLNRNLKLQKGLEIHHWNYNDEYLEDYFILSIKEHKKLHSNLIFDFETRTFFTKDNLILNTRELHKNFIESRGITIIQNGSSIRPL